MDFYKIGMSQKKQNGPIELYPSFIIKKSRDIMVKGKSFVAIWNKEQNIWTTDEYEAIQLIDDDLRMQAEKIRAEAPPYEKYVVKYVGELTDGSYSKFDKYITMSPDSSAELDNKIVFANTKTKKTDYISKRLDYDLKDGDHSSYDELMSTLYSDDERAKLEWAIGAVISGDSKTIQKFIVLFGDPGAGKGTVLEIIRKLFQDYVGYFDAKNLSSNNSAHATETFKSNPLIAIQNDGDLSKIEDNTTLNTIISHEHILINEKYKSAYPVRLNCFLFMATNSAVKITDAKSGMLRRLIDVHPTGNRVPPHIYDELMNRIDFELGAIAWHCLEVYKSMGKNYYKNYKPLDMIKRTDVFFNFVEDNYFVFKDEDGIPLKQAYDMYKEYCDETGLSYKLARHKFREELKNYFGEFNERYVTEDGERVRSYYSTFLTEKFQEQLADKTPEEEKPLSLVLDQTTSLLDEMLLDCPAQLASVNETPIKKWKDVKTTLEAINTKKTHYVKPKDIHHVVIDFDLKDEEGNKSAVKNLEAASLWPPTYAEYSKGGEGIHLHYTYDGDVRKLSSVYDDDIEIKVFTGKSSLRRRLSKCNNLEVATISSGLPLKGEKMINEAVVKNEKHMRNLIAKALRKSIHPGTKPNVDFIHAILEEAYAKGIHYDVSDMRPEILAFANNSTNQAQACIKLVSDMKWHSDEPSTGGHYDGEELIFYDVEVFPNFFGVVWKKKGGTKVQMINPSPSEIGELLKFRLIGYNNRRYDNHIIYARYLGYNNEQLYKLSKRIIDNSKNATFREAYGLSYTDIYDYTTTKQSLKQWEIDLGIHHKELGIPWDEPITDDQIPAVMEYCGYDVDATEAVFDATEEDFMARQILADMSGLTVNDTTQRHAAKIIFGDDREPQSKFVYTDLSEMFPGYVFERGKSTYRGEDPSEGGYVYAEPGMYGNVALLDVKSEHPNSLINLNHFGDEYTKKFADIVSGRVAIKESRFDDAREMLNGVFTKYLVGAEDDEEIGKKLGYSLKIVINIVYGMTSAKFPNPFKDPRNIDNIVAKRGALFMIDLKHAVQEQGYTVAHIKTDSIKIPDADDYIINFVIDFGKKYGYEFDHEATYEKMCLVNNAVYIAKYKTKAGKPCSNWTATGAQFKHPYVFKTLFSKEPIEFKDKCETKSVKSAMYLDMNESLWGEEKI